MTVGMEQWLRTITLLTAASKTPGGCAQTISRRTKIFSETVQVRIRRLVSTCDNEGITTSHVVLQVEY